MEPKLTLRIEEFKDGEDDDHGYSFIFKIRTNDMIIEIRYDEPYVYARKNWFGFYESVKKNTTNSVGDICTSDGHTKFTVENNGSMGEGGEISVSIKNEYCLDALKDAVEYIFQKE